MQVKVQRMNDASLQLYQILSYVVHVPLLFDQADHSVEVWLYRLLELRSHQSPNDG